MTLALLGLVALCLFNGLLGGLADGTGFYPLTLLWSFASGMAYGSAAVMWVLR